MGVVSCAGRDVCDRAIPHPEETYDVRVHVRVRVCVRACACVECDQVQQ